MVARRTQTIACELVCDIGYLSGAFPRSVPRRVCLYVSADSEARTGTHTRHFAAALAARGSVWHALQLAWRGRERKLRHTLTECGRGFSAARLGLTPRARKYPSKTGRARTGAMDRLTALGGARAAHAETRARRCAATCPDEQRPRTYPPAGPFGSRPPLDSWLPTALATCATWTHGGVGPKPPEVVPQS